MNDNKFINDIPVERSKVPNDNFPVITVYTKSINIINREETDYRDALDIVNININQEKSHSTIRDENKYNRSIIDCGNINIKTGGYCQNVIEFDIWNNEPDISEGFTQKYFDDAKECKIYITDENYNKLDADYLQVFIKSPNEKAFELLDEYVPTGNFTNIPGLLCGKSDHFKVQILIKVYPFKFKAFDNDVFFHVCFEYKTDNVFKDYLGEYTNVTKLNFPCKINISNNDREAEFEKIGMSSGGVTTGRLNINNKFLNIKNSFPMTKIVAKRVDSNFIYDYCNTNNDVYALFLPNGIYNLNFNSSNFNKDFREFEIKKGIEEYYTKINNSDIIDIIDDTLVLLDKRRRNNQIQGYIVDEYDNPLKNAEIIISQFEKMIVYCKTNEKGMYNFILNNSGNYDIRIRTNEKNIKLISNFKYDKSKGFIKQLQEQNVIFNKVNLIVR